MSVIYMLITISLVVAILFFFLFVKAVKGGQYDDVYTPSVRMLFDDEEIEEQEKEKRVVKDDASTDDSVKKDAKNKECS